MSVCGPGFSDETLMTSVPWDEIDIWFDARAKAAGHSKYQHVEVVTRDPPTADQIAIEKAGREMAYNMGKSISELYLKSF